MEQSRRSLVTPLLVVQIMKLIKNISLAVMMVFLFSFPQCSIASKNLQQIPKKITEKYIAKENLDKIKIAQRQRRPGPRGGMGRQNDEGEASMSESAEGTSEMQSDQSMGQTQRRRGRRMRNRMRNRMQQRGMRSEERRQRKEFRSPRTPYK